MKAEGVDKGDNPGYPLISPLLIVPDIVMCFFFWEREAITLGLRGAGYGCK